MKYILALAAILLILGCTSQPPVSADIAPFVVKGDHVAVDYTGRLENGTVFDSSIGRAPLEFDAGAGQMIKGFDAAVMGMVEGEEKKVTITPEDAYGQRDLSRIIEVPVANVPEGAKAGDELIAGSQVVRLVEINNSTAVIDVNHPLAGKTLIFDIKIVNITKK